MDYDDSWITLNKQLLSKIAHLCPAAYQTLQKQYHMIIVKLNVNEIKIMLALTMSSVKCFIVNFSESANCKHKHLTLLLAFLLEMYRNSDMLFKSVCILLSN